MNKTSSFTIAFPIALILLFLFVLLQKMGIVNLIHAEKVTYGTAFFIGIVASLSSCMAMVGGLVLSMSATFAKEKNSLAPQILFHISRLVAFFVLGGVIGGIGSVFTLSTYATFILDFIAGIIMLILGINLLELFPWTEHLTPRMPEFLSKHAMRVSSLKHTFTPILFGIATFFLPCGFTQSMQMYTLTTGHFLIGGLTMFVFALGTLPALALITFSSVNFQNNPKSDIFFKTAGLVVIAFALLNILNSFVVLGVINPIFNF